MEIKVSFYPGGRVIAIATDLITDHWDDYRHHIEEARKLESDGDAHGVSRSIRSALFSLYSHLDGVVVNLHNALSKARTDFKPRPRMDRKEFCLREKIGHLRTFAKQHLNSSPFNMCPVPL